MTKQVIIKKVKALNLPKGSYIVFGSCPLALAGLREANDIDLLVNDKLLNRLRAEGWKQTNKGPHDKPLVWDVFEAHNKWNFSAYQPTLEQLLETALVIEDVPFASLDEVRQWKVASGRPKDLEDIALIDAYFSR
ncbi:MAG TPA: hypothetical protein VH234_02585 [Candidatus Saccharimonadales bacterium]|jgi:hypothetical protein|nr:hypothetical protein [Candidatus Saccharimonadales bacterium]